MPFTKGNQYRLEPKHTKEDLEVIRKLLDQKRPVEEIFGIMYLRRPDVHVMTIYRWIEKVAKEKK